MAGHIVVTGGSGKAGRAVVRELRERGHDVSTVDVEPPADPDGHHLTADLTEASQAHEALSGARAVVHLAAIPAPGLRTDEVTFRTNVASTYNVFAAAAAHRVVRVVWASSETVLGLPFDRTPPAYAPIDEDHPDRPESAYALSKVVGETLAAEFARWSGIPFAGLRYSNIMEPHDYRHFPDWWGEPQLRRWNLWGYVDARDAALATRLALEADLTGAEVFVVAATDTVMDRPSRDLLAEVYPTVPIRGDLGRFGSLLATGKAARLLGYRPVQSWRDYVRPGT